jgi:hypothetical protein
LSAIQALGKKAAPLLDIVRTMPIDGPSPDARYDSYVPRLVEDITTGLGGQRANPPPTGKSKGKAKGKGKSIPQAAP